MYLILPAILLLGGLGVYLTFHSNLLVSISPGILALMAGMFWKKLSTEREIGKIEAEIPNAAMKMAMSLDSGMSFLQSLREVSIGNDKLAEEMRHVMREIDGGSSVPLALENSARKVKSREYSKFINRLILLYKFGGNGDSLRKLSKDIVEQRKIELKRYSGKVIMYSLILVSLSSILPAMFLAYLVVGSMFMSIDVTPIDALLIPSLLFPSLNLALILLIQSKKPRFVW